MASEELIDAKLEAFEMRMEDKLRTLLAKFGLGKPPSPRRSQHDESSDHKENLPERGEHMTNSSYPQMRMDFPRWEDGDPTGWFSCTKRYFHYHRIPEASMVDIATIHLKRDVIQWYNWFEYTQGVPT
ncbi:hypothetical protein GW17_00055434 [Ensete ventricosum]|nr:hypothetical protein GW17_00055434 [Ensete ventricosum]